jgi:hypothetical protein
MKKITRREFLKAAPVFIAGIAFPDIMLEEYSDIVSAVIQNDFRICLHRQKNNYNY